MTAESTSALHCQPCAGRPMVGGRLETWAVATGVATFIVTVIWRVVFQDWATGASPTRYDLFEPYLDTWAGMSWLTQAVLWPAFLFRRWAWIPLVAVAAAAVALQSLMAIGSAWLGIADGTVSVQGAVMGSLSVVQLGLTSAWILLLSLSKRMAA